MRLPSTRAPSWANARTVATAGIVATLALTTAGLAFAGPLDDLNPLVDVETTGDADSAIAASGTGAADGDVIAVSGGGDAAAPEGNVLGLAASGTGTASGYVAVSGTGDAHGYYPGYGVGVSGTGDASGSLAAVSAGQGSARVAGQHVSVTGILAAIDGLPDHPLVTPFVNLEREGDADHGAVAVAPAGAAYNCWVCVANGAGSRADNGIVSVSTRGGSSGMVAVAGFGDASGLVAASARGAATSRHLGVAGDGPATGDVAIASEAADGEYVGLGGTYADGDVAVATDGPARCDWRGDCILAVATGDAWANDGNGIAISTDGTATGSVLGASLGGDATSRSFAVSGTGDATADSTISITGDATGGPAVSVTGDARGWPAVSALGSGDDVGGCSDVILIWTALDATRRSACATLHRYV